MKETTCICPPSRTHVFASVNIFQQQTNEQTVTYHFQFSILYSSHWRRSNMCRKQGGTLESQAREDSIVGWHSSFSSVPETSFKFIVEVVAFLSLWRSKKATIHKQLRKKKSIQQIKQKVKCSQSQSSCRNINLCGWDVSHSGLWRYCQSGCNTKPIFEIISSVKLIFSSEFQIMEALIAFF